MVEGWVVPENRALARRPQILGLPLGYAALLIMATMYLVLSAHLIGAGLYLLGVGWGFGRLVTFYDPFAFELLGASLRIPRVMRP